MQTSLPREELRITTKVRINNYTPERCAASLHASMTKLQTDYLDLVLLHRPNTRVGHHEVLDVLMERKQRDRIRHIGVSNFTIALLQDALNHTQGQIFTNQIEYHACFDPLNLRTFCQERHILITAYSPLGKGILLHTPILQTIATKHGVSIAQVALQRLIGQPSVIAIPKATRREHLQENFAASTLLLDEDDREAIRKLSKDQRQVNPVFHPLRDD